MDSPFIYNKFVSGRHFIGRRSECLALSNMLKAGENVVISEPSKTGKTSLVQQTFYNMRIEGAAFEVAELSLFNVRTAEDLMLKLGSTVLRLFCTTPQEYAQAAAKYLSGTHFVFDPEAFAATDSVLSAGWTMDEEDLRAVFTLPWRIARENGRRCIILLDEFQDILLCENPLRLLKSIEGIIEGVSAEDAPLCSFVFMGSKVNAMHEIFHNYRFLMRSVEKLPLNEIPTKDIIDYVVRGFLTSGKVIERDLLLGVCKLFRSNIWYINHFASICDSLSKGYITESVLIEALDMMLSIHKPRFLAAMEDLTTFQVSLLRAALEGHTRFSSSEVISRYGLNSSANVRRLKDALCKKEILLFDEKDEPQVIDPLFEYWMRKYYFELKDE